MEVRKLFAESMKAALNRVQTELGDDALILSTRSVNGGVEVTVSTDLPEPVGTRAVEARQQAAVRYARDPLLDRYEVEARLRRSGIDHERIATWMAGFEPSDPIRAVARHMPVAPRPVAPESGRWAVVGMPGAGKTTLISSLASNHALRYGPDNVALISMDTWRAGGAEQLKIVARLLGVPVFVARNAEDVARMLKVVDSRSLVLVDTPGIPLGQKRHGLLEPLAALMPLVLALPATLSATVQQRLLAEHDGVCDALAMTHLDQVVSPGESIEVALRAQKYFWWMTYGASIPDNIDSADAVALARRVLALDEAVRAPIEHEDARGPGAGHRTESKDIKSAGHRTDRGDPGDEQPSGPEAGQYR